MSNPDIIALYSTSQTGGDLPYFVGKQYGSGWLQTIGRFALPILRRIGAVGMKTAQDVINNKAKILPSLKTNVMNEFNNFLDSDELAKMISKPKGEENLKGNGIKRKNSILMGINKRIKRSKTIFD